MTGLSLLIAVGCKCTDNQKCKDDESAVVQRRPGVKSPSVRYLTEEPSEENGENVYYNVCYVSMG